MTRRLTDYELQTYEEQGYVVLHDVFPRREMEAMNAELDAFLQSEKASEHLNIQAPAGPGWIMALGLATEKTRDFCEDPRILDLVESLVYPGIAIYSAKLVTKEPLSPTICHWHQDEAYYNRRVKANHRMSIWAPLQDTTVEQGCLEVIPGSHRRGLQPAINRETGTCSLSLDVPVDLENRVYCPIPMGSMILFDSLLWHASAGNTTNQRRRSFIVSYQEATAEGGNGKQWKILRPAQRMTA